MRIPLCCVLAAALTACAPLPRGPATLAAQWQPSVNFDERRPNYVILHQTGSDTVERAMRALTDPQRKVSSHYLIGRDGTLYQLVDERLRAWHAGESRWGGSSDLNSASIGIELDNDGEEPFAAAQVDTLLRLLGDIVPRYRIPAANILGHGDVAPTRKADPSRHFPWQTLAAHGFGLWCDAAVPSAASPDVALALQAIGYDIADLRAAERAFRRHFLQDESDEPLGEAERRLLACLLNARNGKAVK